jgi:hypothetical protein
MSVPQHGGLLEIDQGIDWQKRDGPLLSRLFNHNLIFLLPSTFRTTVVFKLAGR